MYPFVEGGVTNANCNDQPLNWFYRVSVNRKALQKPKNVCSSASDLMNQLLLIIAFVNEKGEDWL